MLPFGARLEQIRCGASNRLPVAVELMVLVVAALARAKVGEIVHELDGRDPFHHLETQLVLATQPGCLRCW